MITVTNMAFYFLAKLHFTYIHSCLLLTMIILSRIYIHGQKLYPHITKRNWWFYFFKKVTFKVILLQEEKNVYESCIFYFSFIFVVSCEKSWRFCCIILIYGLNWIIQKISTYNTALYCFTICSYVTNPNRTLVIHDAM